MANKGASCPDGFSREKFWAILILSFVSGAGVMVLEICASRMLSPYFGNSIFVWGSLIGIVLLALSLGYLFGGIFADRFPSEKALFSIISLSGILVFLIPVFSAPVFWFLRRFGYVLGPLVSSIIVFLPPAVLLGAVSPYALKLVGSGEKRAKTLGKSSGILYAVSTGGSLVGTFLATFFLAPFFGTRETVLGLGIVLFFSGAGALLFFSGKRKALVAVSPLFVLSFLFLGSLPSFGESSDPNKYSLVHSEESLYQKIEILDTFREGDPGRGVRIISLDHLVSGGSPFNDTSRSYYHYVDCFSMAYSIEPKIKNALFIGGGAFSLPRMFLRGDPSMSIDVVEIDPAVVDVAEKYLNLSKDPGFRIFVGDGRMFLEEQKSKKYDFIGIDAYLSGKVPTHMLTVEFFELVKERLSENGTVAINVLGSAEGTFSKLVSAEKRTLSQVFPSVYAFPIGRLKERSDKTTVLIFGSKSPGLVPSEFLKKRSYETAGSLRIPEIPNCMNNYIPENPADAEGTVFTDNFSPINNLLNPEMSSSVILG